MLMEPNITPVFFWRKPLAIREGRHAERGINFFWGIWTGAGSEFYIKRKNETEIAVMYHDIQCENNPLDFAGDDYEEILAIPTDNEKEIEIVEPVIF